MPSVSIGQFLGSTAVHDGEAAVEIQPQWFTFGITRRVTRVFLVVMMVLH